MSKAETRLWLVSETRQGFKRHKGSRASSTGGQLRSARDCLAEGKIGHAEVLCTSKAQLQNRCGAARADVGPRLTVADIPQGGAYSYVWLTSVFLCAY